MTLPDGIQFENDLTVITQMTAHYIASESTSTPDHYEFQYFHVPIFWFFIMAIPLMFIFKRIIIEILIRLRK